MSFGAGMELRRRCWLEIDLNRIGENCRIYAERLRPSCPIMAVVKADAYGHGDGAVAKFLSDAGVRHFAVSNIDEAIHIRRAGAEGQVLILGYPPPSRVEELVPYGLTQTLLSQEYAEEIAQTHLPIQCHFAIDTGMRRIGLNADDPAACEAIIRSYAARLRLDGLFTHLCVADSAGEEAIAFTEEQIQKFEAVCARVADLNLPHCHCMNSAGGLRYRSRFSNLARLGIVLYGLKPDYENTLPTGIKPALSWKSVVSMVKDVNPGDTVGYGRTFRAERRMTLATIPTGYADGYSRLLSNRGHVLIRGHRAPIAGRICMDQMMADVTEIPGVSLGAEVVLVGRSGEETITADDLAQLCGTIGYEVICGISKRVERVYL